MPAEANTKLFKCHNPLCNKNVWRSLADIVPSGHVYCSHHCAATITNTLRPSRKLPRNKCANPSCQNMVEEYGCSCCSRKCRYIFGYLKRGYTKAGIIHWLKNFHTKQQRIPLKRESYRFYRSARRLFGTWNKAIEAAGLTPNPVMFANHHVARDGHKCDSLVERILDDWLWRHKIPHQTHVRYPWGGLMSADFKIGEYWIELFGLKGQLAKYDSLRREKLILIKKYNLKFISLETIDVMVPKILSAKLAPILMC